MLTSTLEHTFGAVAIEPQFQGCAHQREGMDKNTKERCSALLYLFRPGNLTGVRAFLVVEDPALGENADEAALAPPIADEPAALPLPNMPEGVLVEEAPNPEEAEVPKLEAAGLLPKLPPVAAGKPFDAGAAAPKAGLELNVLEAPKVVLAGFCPKPLELATAVAPKPPEAAGAAIVLPKPDALGVEAPNAGFDGVEEALGNPDVVEPKPL